MPRHSAGLLPYRVRDDVVEVLIGHPGGPFWAKKDDGAWSILKGEYVDGEDPWEVAQREFTEETGLAPPAGPRIDFEPVRQPSGKVLTSATRTATPLRSSGPRGRDECVSSRKSIACNGFRWAKRV